MLARVRDRPKVRDRSSRAAARVALAVALIVSVAGASEQASPSTSLADSSSAQVRAAASGCRTGRLADRRCTPGSSFQVGEGQVCVSGYSRRVRDVPESEKRQVYVEYGIYSHVRGQYEVDHLVPLELGGDNSIRNLWPEAAQPRPGFHEKDRLENALHDLVCGGRLSLRRAQSLIAGNWVAAFNRYR
jgi:hypothetical protein